MASFSKRLHPNKFTSFLKIFLIDSTIEQYLGNFFVGSFGDEARKLHKQPQIASFVSAIGQKYQLVPNLNFKYPWVMKL